MGEKLDHSNFQVTQMLTKLMFFCSKNSILYAILHECTETINPVCCYNANESIIWKLLNQYTTNKIYFIPLQQCAAIFVNWLHVTLPTSMIKNGNSFTCFNELLIEHDTVH